MLIIFLLVCLHVGYSPFVRSMEGPGLGAELPTFFNLIASVPSEQPVKLSAIGTAFNQLCGPFIRSIKKLSNDTKFRELHRLAQRIKQSVGVNDDYYDEHDKIKKNPYSLMEIIAQHCEGDIKFELKMCLFYAGFKVNDFSKRGALKPLFFTFAEACEDAFKCIKKLIKLGALKNINQVDNKNKNFLHYLCHKLYDLESLSKEKLGYLEQFFKLLNEKCINLNGKARMSAYSHKVDTILKTPLDILQEKSAVVEKRGYEIKEGFKDVIGRLRDLGARYASEV